MVAPLIQLMKPKPKDGARQKLMRLEITSQAETIGVTAPKAALQRSFQVCVIISKIKTV